MIRKIKKNLKELGFKDNEIKVYLALTSLGEARASLVAKKAGLARTTTISILKKLYEESFLTIHRHKGVDYYWIESPDVLSEVFENKMNFAKDLGSVLGDLYRTEHGFPTAKVIDTKKGIRNYIENLLTKTRKNTTIFTIDAPGVGNYKKIFSEGLESNLVELKRRKNIFTKTLVPYGSFEGIEKRKVRNMEIREMPKGIKFEASIWIIGDELVHFSGHSPFVVAIKHKKIVGGMKSVYDFLWMSSVRF